MKHLAGCGVVALIAACSWSDPALALSLQSGDQNSALQPEFRQADVTSMPPTSGDEPEEQQAEEAPVEDTQAEEAPAEEAPAAAETPQLDVPVDTTPPQKELAIPEKAEGGVVARPLLRSKHVPEIGIIKKPKVPEIFKPYIRKFFKDTPTEGNALENCNDVVEELQTQQNAVGSYIYLKIFLQQLNPELLVTNSERVNADKESEIALRNAKGFLVNSGGGDGISNDLLNYVSRLIKCKVPPMEDNMGMLQKMIAMGYAKSLQSLFAYYMLRGTDDYDPAYALDSKGNTIMHLAVQSGSYEIPGILTQLENRKNFGDVQRKLNTVFWVLSALERENDDGMKPFALATDGNMVRKLKEIFRSNTTFLKFLAREGGIPGDADELAEMQKKITSSLEAQAAAVGA